ncbi:TetR/AcrR family transcriptional regulator [Paenibacillus protaetiae]|uniref:TetR/AcrR family transcriptional regulator n=1 Tax=Paenibacillus protaetiae TaxID=2509456 RepID=A0A4P6EW70_9BACL|nr:TetR/AcrR family transcriptional regulator [Paenibacillus protaetiae]QAY67580.1 TetR/AcrR family transcriptional regulator [Paenibacillus protaetiae]
MNDIQLTNTRTERRDAAANRQRILNAALKLFDQHGVEQVSMNQIATEAKIGPGTLYRRYKNKSELCLDLIKDHLDLLFDDLEAYLADNESLPPSERLRGLIALFLRFREKKAQLLAGVEEAGSSRPKNRGRGPVYEELHQLIVQLFDEMALAAPPAEPRANSVFRADMLLSALSSDSYLFQRDGRGYTPEQIWEQLCLTFFPQQLR